MLEFLKHNHVDTKKLKGLLESWKRICNDKLVEKNGHIQY